MLRWTILWFNTASFLLFQQDHFTLDVFSLVLLMLGFRVLAYLALLTKTVRKEWVPPKLATFAFWYRLYNSMKVMSKMYSHVFIKPHICCHFFHVSSLNCVPYCVSVTTSIFLALGTQIWASREGLPVWNISNLVGPGALAMTGPPTGLLYISVGQTV